MSFASNKALLAITSNSEIGSIVRIATDSAPTGFLACNGQAVSRSSYSNLFNVVGTTFGVGDGSTTFNVPFDTSLKQYDLTVTGTNWTSTSEAAIGIPYQDSEGIWRLKANIRGTISTVASSLTLSVSGITFKNATNFQQAVTTYLRDSSGSIAPKVHYASPNTDDIVLGAGANFNKISISLDVELDSKPSFVDDNGSDYSINQYVRALPRTAIQGVSPSTVSKSANYTILDNDGLDMILATTGSSANVVFNLPTLSDNIGRIIEVVKVDSGTKFFELNPEGSETIRGSTTSIYGIQQGESIRLLGTSSDWVLLGDPMRTVSIYVLNSGSPTISTQTGTWSSGLDDNGEGSTNINVITGVFLEAPYATGNCKSADTHLCFTQALTTSDIGNVRTRDNVPGSNDVDFWVTAQGKK